MSHFIPCAFLLQILENFCQFYRQKKDWHVTYFRLIWQGYCRVNGAAMAINAARKNPEYCQSLCQITFGFSSGMVVFSGCIVRVIGYVMAVPNA